MSVDRLFTVPTVSPGPISPGRDRTALESLKADELAKEFESIMMLQMLRQMRQSMVDESNEEEGLSASTWLDTIDQELARQLSQKGGLGLAEAMTAAIKRQALEPVEAGVADPGPVAASGLAASRPVVGSGGVPRAGEASRDGGASEAAADPTGVSAHRLSSDFGWRSDPFSGLPKYHRGIDLRAAYGQEVPAAADGRVIEAGERGAYGLTVLIEHENGVRTRYAHLSTLGVAAGDRVLQGQDIGRVGQSGRATGPHLHFEVIQNGQRVDPTTMVALNGAGLGGLKLAGGVADSMVGGHAHVPATTGVDDED